MTTLRISAQGQTEDLLKFITSELDDNDLDSIQVTREFSEPTGLASEPITIGVVLVLTPVLTVVVTRLIERWMETDRQQQQAKVLLEAYNVSAEAGEALKELMIKQNDVSVTLGSLPDIPEADTSNLG